MVHAINNLQQYNDRMRKSMLDKIFFIDKIDDLNVVVDFGCADGSLIGYLSNLFPEITYIGYDISEEMLAQARRNYPNLKFYSDWNKLEYHLFDQYPNKKIAVLCSSIIHEVYSYLNKEAIEKFWKRIYDTNLFDYVIIRDMCIDKSAIREADPIDVAILKKYECARSLEFNQVWGDFSDNKNILHYMLKYRYDSVREMYENYLPITLQTLLYKIPKTHELVYFDHYILPFIKNGVKEDFGIILKDNTHVKMIVKVKR